MPDAGSGPRVLVVDDDPVLRLMTAHMLRSACSAVESAESVAGALAIMDGTDFDVIVCDYLMPGESGLSLAAACADRSIGFILLSGTAEDDFVDDPRYAHVDTHLTKPVSTGALVEAVLGRAAESSS